MSKFRTVVLAIGVMFCANIYAQNRPLACQMDKTIGLVSEGGAWKIAIPSGFETNRFILVLQRDLNLDGNAVARVLSVAPSVTCQIVFRGRVSCSSQLGNYLFFDPTTMKGGISNLFGGIMDPTNGENLSVQAFTCQPF